MAEAIARGLIAKLYLNAPIVLASAGVSASREPYSHETGAAVEALGFEAPRGRSRALTAEALAAATNVYAMTRSHLAAIKRLDATAAAKAQLLDPAGNDVPDPIGGSQALYDATARAMRDMIAARLKEFTS